MCGKKIWKYKCNGKNQFFIYFVLCVLLAKLRHIEGSFPFHTVLTDTLSVDIQPHTRTKHITMTPKNLKLSLISLHFILSHSTRRKQPGLAKDMKKWEHSFKFLFIWSSCDRYMCNFKHLIFIQSEHVFNMQQWKAWKTAQIHNSYHYYRPGQNLGCKLHQWPSCNKCEAHTEEY